MPRFGVHHDPAAVYEGQLLPGLVEDVGDPLHRAFFARLTGSIQHDLLAAGGHPVDLHGLLAHQKRRVAGGKEIVVHAVGAGVIRRSLLHITEQGAGFELPVKITVGVQNGRSFSKVVQFHGKKYPLYQKQAAPFAAQPAWINTCSAIFCAACARC